MKYLKRTSGFIAVSFCLLLGCSKPTASDVSGVYSFQTGRTKVVLTLQTNGSYQRAFYHAGAVESSQAGTWNFDATQSLVFLDRRFVFAFDDRSAQASLMQTSTPALPKPTTFTTIGGTNIPITDPFEILYRTASK